MGDSSRYVHLDVDEILRETENAFLLKIEDDEVWVPKSQISDAGDYKEGDTDCTVFVTKWFADKEGLG